MKKNMSFFLNNEATGANSHTFKYTWDDPPLRGTFRGPTRIYKSPLFRPENFDLIKFQLCIKYGFVNGSVHLILASSDEEEEPSLSFKFKFLTSLSKKFYSTNSNIILRNEGIVTLTIGQSCELSTVSHKTCGSFQCELQLEKPYKQNFPITNELKTEFQALTCDFNSLRFDSRFVDVNFVAGGKEFAANKMILSARSPVFSVMFDQTQFVENRENRVEITDIDAQTFEALLEFIYTSEVKELDQIAPSLLIAAHKYDIKSLIEVCSQSMLKTINTQNVVEYLMYSKIYSLSELKDKALDLINPNFQVLTKSEDFIKHVKPDYLLMQELYLDFATKQSKI